VRWSACRLSAAITLLPPHTANSSACPCTTGCRSSSSSSSSSRCHGWSQPRHQRGDAVSRPARAVQGGADLHLAGKGVQ
jgi:hypothetical protein